MKSGLHQFLTLNKDYTKKNIIRRKTVGDVTVIVRTDLLLYSLLIDIILLIYLYRHSCKGNESAKMVSHVILAIGIVTVFEAISWFTGEIGNRSLIPLHYWSNFLFLAFLGVPEALGIRYLDYRIFGDKKKSNKRLFIYLIPTYINIGFAVYNLFDEGFLFYIDNIERINQYVRGIGVTISTAIIYALLVIVIIVFYRYRRLITGRIAQSIMTFFFLPVIGSILQMLAYGTTFGMASYTLAVFIIFMILEKDEMGKDELTGLYTRAKLASRLSFKLKAQEAFSIIMTDINDFKGINDTYGHSEGDKVLKKVAEILVNSVSIEDMVCRYGGDEFLILIEYPEDIGEEIIERIKRALDKYNQSVCYIVKLSYGYEYVSNPSSDGMEELLHRVDRNMYKDRNMHIKKPE